jgi:hypothetical protein
MFNEEKQKEEKPHLQSFLIEKAKSRNNTGKVRYAKEKLNKLSQQYRK